MSAPWGAGCGRSALLALLVLVAVVAGCGSSGNSISDSDLGTAPSSGWLTNGGDFSNDRYSPLTTINASNVGQLKGVWLTHLRNSGTAAKYSSGETQPLIYKGVIYTTTGADDVFALSVKTGAIMWEYKANLDQSISTVCCGWLNRGVAIGDGRLYLGQLDGKIVALNQKTGAVEWTRQLVQWQTGQTITGAPLYMDGKIFIGVVGADFGTRGFFEALDAKTGKSVWRFYTIPGPHDPGGDTWPSGSSAYKRGGASVWSTPAYDPKLGLLYFSTGNAGSDWYGGQRPGKNLYANSIIALDAKTGTLKWYYQEVHHDIWDYDAPSAVILFDAKTSGGNTVPAIAQPGKTGWLYMLNRETGKPIFSTPEEPVPQDAAQKTWPTQPIPSVGAFIPHGQPPASQVARVTRERTGAGADVPVEVARTMYTPPSTTRLTIYSPGPQGGDNWEPASYNPKTQMFYVCAAVQTVGIMGAQNPFKPGESYAGVGALAGFSWTESTGTFTAIDGNTGRVVWQHTWPESCYSGTSTTAGNLVFVGRNAGQLQAYNATTGKLLWSFQTGAGANGSPTAFEDGGKEYVAFYAAGNSLQASPHGDSFWLFGLDGTLGPAAAPGPGVGTTHAGAGGGATTTAGDAAAGRVVFENNCATCHGSLGTGGNGGPDLTSIPSAKRLANVVTQVTNGGNGMPAFSSILTKQQIADVAAYVTTKITENNH
jgi:quinohemoprotein ethanol dehydrogenase